MSKRYKVVTLLLSIITLISLSGCHKKVDVEDETINKFELNELSERKERVDEEEVVDTTNTADITNSSDKEAELAELELLGNDDSQYYAQVNNGEDIQFGAVTYIGLNKAVDSIKQPYTKRQFINFIVKTYNPTRNKVLISYINEEDPDTVPELMSMTISDSLNLNWDGYSALLNKYGMKAKWMLTLCEADTYERSAFLYGCDKYVIYLGSNGIVQIDMDKYKDIQPNEKTEKYVSPDVPSGNGEDNIGDSSSKGLVPYAGAPTQSIDENGSDGPPEDWDEEQALAERSANAETETEIETEYEIYRYEDQNFEEMDLYGIDFEEE